MQYVSCYNHLYKIENTTVTKIYEDIANKNINPAYPDKHVLHINMSAHATSLKNISDNYMLK